MSIYSSPVKSVAARAASKQQAQEQKKKKPELALTETQPHDEQLENETPQEKRNRLARERRARLKQEKADAENGVTLATGKITPIVRDELDAVLKPPINKMVVGGGGAGGKKVQKQTASISIENGAAETTAAVSTPTDHTASSSKERVPLKRKNGESGDMETSNEPDEGGPAIPPKKKRWPRVPVEDAEEPPKWYTSLLSDVIKHKIDQAGEKATKKVIKETSEEVAKEKWADPMERGRQDKLFNQIFRSVY